MSIEFCGEISEETINTLSRWKFLRVLKKVICIGLPILIILSIWSIILSKYRLFYIVFIGIDLCIAIFIIIMAKIGYKRDFKRFLPYKVSILEETKVIEVNGRNGTKRYDWNDIRSINDFGLFFHIKTVLKESYIICEKDLLKNGSLLEFEQLFKEKIKKISV